ncbi:TPA: DUF1187 family protein [Escherichia coli]|nr:DUF1187 family protein [Escherichia coli]HAX5186607.1 DUF1187 family protein [Escherichia coli]HAX5233347.1 DUF1187 family protein [Escherichia coli]
MVNTYKITAMILKPGSAPVKWVHYSCKKITLNECKKKFAISGARAKFSKSYYEVMIEDFRCITISKDSDELA